VISPGATTIQQTAAGCRRGVCGSHVSRIAVPVIGLLVVTAALALIGTAPLVLFPSPEGIGPLPAPPAASSEVASVTAHRVHPEREASRPPATPPSSTASTSGSSEGTLLTAAPSSEAGGGATEGAGGGAGAGPPIQNGGTTIERPTSRTGTEQHGKGKLNGTHKGKAKGHDKDKARGEAKGHTKWHANTQIAFAPPRGSKPDHVHPARAGKHAGRGARAHARARR
jgi:hypothetical protein